MIICEVLTIVIPASLGLIYTPSSFCSSTPMKIVSLVLLVTSNYRVKGCFSVSLHILFSLSAAFHRIAHSTVWIMVHVLLKTAIMVPSYRFFFFSLLNVGNLLPSCPSTRVPALAHNSYFMYFFWVTLPYLLMIYKSNSRPFFSV